MIVRSTCNEEAPGAVGAAAEGVAPMKGTEVSTPTIAQPDDIHETLQPVATVRAFTRSIARTLRALRRERKMSQAKAAHLMHQQGVEMHRSTISRIERAQLDISMGDLCAFCRVYGVNVGYVLLSAELGRLMAKAVLK